MSAEHDDGCQILRLAADGDVETWLDLTTGRQLVGRVDRAATAGPAAATHSFPPLTPLIEVARVAIDGNAWRCEGEGKLSYAIHGRRAEYEGVVVAMEEVRSLTAYCVFAPRVPQARRPAMLEAMARANFCLHTGAFEMNLADGELRFRDGLIARHSDPPLRYVLDMLSFCAYICDRYHDALMSVAFGGAEPAAAIEEVEAR